MLWKLLPTEDLVKILVDPKLGTCNKVVMTNCDRSQIDAVVKQLTDKQIETLNATWLEMLYIPPAETIRDLERELESEAKVQQSTP